MTSSAIYPRVAAFDNVPNDTVQQTEPRILAKSGATVSEIHDSTGSHMTATAGSIAKLPTRNVPKMAQEPQMSSMMLRVLWRNQREKMLMTAMMIFTVSMTYHATDFAVSSALLSGGCSSSHGKHKPAAIVSHNAEVITPLFPFEVIFVVEKSWLDSPLLPMLDGPAIGRPVTPGTVVKHYTIIRARKIKLYFRTCIFVYPWS